MVRWYTTEMLRLIERPEEAAALAETLRRAGRFVFDLETNGLHAYRSRVCLAQFAAEGMEAAAIDVVAGGAAAVTPLADLFADPAVEKIVHGASHDVASLKEDFRLPLRGIFDTYVAASMLGRPKVGLADLVAETAGVVLAKDLQKCDWAARPLTPEMLGYLERDVVYLHAVAARLRADLAAAEIEEEAAIEFRRVEETPPTGLAFDTLGYRGITGAKDLDDAGLSVLREVWLLRDRIAERLDLPAFKVLAEGAMLGLALRARRGRRAVDESRSLRRRDLQPYVGEVADAVERGLAAGRIPDAERPERRPPSPREGPRPPRAEREEIRRRADVLRAWRKEESKRRALPTVTILPNPVLHAIAAENPPTAEALAAIDGLGRSRQARYAGVILDLLRRP